MNQLTHLDAQNQPAMVDVSTKEITAREATAQAVVWLGAEIMELLAGSDDIPSKKGPVFQTAIIAGTMAAKRTSEWIPFCHPLSLEKCKFSIQPCSTNKECVVILCTCKTSARTGVEMEALTGANAAALTIYDMCKALNKGMVIQEVKLLEKSGGKSDYQAH